MKALYLILAIILLISLGAGMWRVVLGPSTADRMLAAQLFGTTAVAFLMLLAQTYTDTAILDVALVFALLAAVTAVAFVQRAWTGRDDENGFE